MIGAAIFVVFLFAFVYGWLTATEWRPEYDKVD